MNRAPHASAPVPAMLSWVIAVAAATLAVSSDSASLTLLIFAVGILYLFFPPSGLFPRSLLILSGLLLLLAATAFLPSSIMPGTFRASFLEQGFVLPATFSPQPWLSLEDLTLLLATLLWAWFCLEARFSGEQRGLLMDGYLIALGLLALTTVFQGAPFFQGLPSVVREAGRFDNHNQTGDLLVIGGIVSFNRGLGKISRHKGMAILWLGLSIVFLAAIIRNDSRMAPVLFGLGILISCFLLPDAHRHQRLLWPVLYLVGLIGALFFVFEGTALRERLALLVTADQEGRVPIYQDASLLILHNPWFGVGLGNFEGVFNTQRFYSLDLTSRALHPESDWFWVGAEMGVGALFILGLMVLLTFRLYLSKTPFPRFTHTSIIVGLLFLIHSFFDVGGHRLGTMWNCLFVVGLGAFHPHSATDWKIPQIGLRAAGLLLLALTVLRVQSMSLHPWMPTRGFIVRTEQPAYPPLPLAEQKELFDRDIRWAPFDWYPYFLRGVVQLHDPNSIPAANADFNRALYLDQATPLLPPAIADVCRHGDFSEVLVASRDQVEKAPPQDKETAFGGIFRPKDDPDALWQLGTLAGDDPDLNVIALGHQYGEQFDSLRQLFLLNNPTLAGVSFPLATRFFNRWFDAGDVSEFVNEWPQHPEWQAAGWKAYAKSLAKLGRYQDAVAIALQFLPKPSMPDFPPPSNPLEAARIYRGNPRDPLNGITLYFAQAAAGDTTGALVTLKEIARLPQCPAYIQYLLAQNLVQANQGYDAWSAIMPLLER